MDEVMSPLERDHFLSVVLPGGLEKKATVHGSKPVMDLLVTLCASYHLNPSDYTVEFLSTNKNNIAFKPNSPIGSLEAEKIVLKPKAVEEKIRRPYMPEATVRLLINYNRCHKTVVRVNPRVPVELLLPAMCEKCEFEVETTVLFRDSGSKEPLDLSKSLNEHGLREVFAKDTSREKYTEHHHEARTTQTAVVSPPALRDLPKKEIKQKENTGFLSLFRRKKERAKLERLLSASPGLNNQSVRSVDEQSVFSPTGQFADTPKKRRAPQPPMGASQSLPNNLGNCHRTTPQRSAESTLRRIKRKAPPPPCANSNQQEMQNKEAMGVVGTGENQESDSLKLSPLSSSSPNESQPHLSTPSSSSRTCLRDFSDARSALAEILRSSLSKGKLVKHLRKSVALLNDDGPLSSELDSEWEDPLQKKGVTTFTVVPSNRLKSPDAPQDLQIEAPSVDAPEAENDETEPEEESCSRGGSDTESPPANEENQASDEAESPPPPPCNLENQDHEMLPDSEVEEDKAENPTECLQSSSRSADVEQCWPNSEEKNVVNDTVPEKEEEEQEFPPPPPPVFFNEDIKPSSSSQSPTSVGQKDTFSTTAAPRPEVKTTASPSSRFAQAVALAVQRSRLLSQAHWKGFGPRGPRDANGELSSTQRSTYQHGA